MPENGSQPPRAEALASRSEAAGPETRALFTSFNDTVSHVQVPAPVSPPAVKPVVIPDSLVPERKGTLAFVSNVERYGDWVLPRHYRALAVMGNLELDLTRARLGAGTSQIEIVCIMGAVTVIVPPDIRIDCDAIPVVGNLEVRRDAESTMASDAPLVQISGTAFMGSIEVKVIDPNAPGWMKRLRARWAKAKAPGT